MWVFDSKGKRTEATAEDAQQMVAEGNGFSCLWPRGTTEEEAFEFDALTKDTSLADAVMRTARPRGTVVPEAAPAESTHRRSPRNR